MITGNEPAYPFTVATENELLSSHLTGLTKREYFAAMAMQGLIVAYPPKLNVSENTWSNVDIISALSTAISDALIKQLNK